MTLKQRLDEWKVLDEKSLAYHKDQWNQPKRSTFAFEEFVSDVLLTSNNVLDLGAGAGAGTAFLAEKNQSVQFTALDYSIDLIETGKSIAAERGLKNISFEQGDWYNLTLSKKFDGCVSLQTLSWLPDYKKALRAIFERVDPVWIAISSLFYEGNITCRVEVEEHNTGKKSFYNTYSLPAISRFCEMHGYELVKCAPFFIDIDIAKPVDVDTMGTYTKQLIDCESNNVQRMQISGPLLMNWYMILIRKVGS